MSRRAVVASLVAVVAILGLATAGTAMLVNPTAMVQLKRRLLADPIEKPPDAPPTVHDVAVSRSDDTDKSSEVHGVIVQEILNQQPRSSGFSQDAIHVNFDAPVEIVGVAVSVDIGTSMELVEVSAGINSQRGYGKAHTADWLIHTSYAGDPWSSAGGKIDEQVWFGPGDGFRVCPDDFVGVGAWLQNQGQVVDGVSPEVLFYYRWVDSGC